MVSSRRRRVRRQPECHLYFTRRATFLSCADRGLIAAIKQTIADHPLTNKTNFNARFNDFGESSLDVLVYFYIETTDYSAELAAREEILLQIMDLAKDLGIEFAFPTRTLVIEAPSEEDLPVARGAIGAVLGRR